MLKERQQKQNGITEILFLVVLLLEKVKQITMQDVKLHMLIGKIKLLLVLTKKEITTKEKTHTKKLMVKTKALTKDTKMEVFTVLLKKYHLLFHQLLHMLVTVFQLPQVVEL